MTSAVRARPHFGASWLPYALLAPQLAITVVFFVWPAALALWQSTAQQDPFGLSTTFVGIANFTRMFGDPLYRASFGTTLVFSTLVTAFALAIALPLAALADRVRRGTRVYKAILVWPYAVPAGIAAVLWAFLFNPGVGILTYMLARAGIVWNHALYPAQALTLVVIAAVWGQVSYNFLFFVAGLQNIPLSLIEASALDGSGPLKRFFTIVLPLLSPTTFFLLAINLVYAFFDTFPIIDASTSGGPGQATQTLVYRIYAEGFKGLDLGSSAAQSVVLMVIVIGLTIVQFRVVERRVHYE